jgi:mono/diheme cytochrome c family protein
LRKRIVLALIAIVALGLAGFAAFAWRPSLAAITPPAASSFPPELVGRGALLASAGNCASCHTVAGGPPYAGGYAMQTPFGVLYSTNITPEITTGIGSWSQAAFRRALHEGVARDGSHLFPAFPYDHFTRLTDADVDALYAYLMTRAPVVSPARRNGIPFPLSLRPLQAGWKLLFFHPGEFKPSPDRGADWNRGAYLVEGLAHCGACHTPRNALGAERTTQAFAGAAVDHWFAPPLNGENPSPVPWSEEELFAFLRSGVSREHGTVLGPMSPVVHESLAHLPPEDIRSIAVYLADLDGAASRSANLASAERVALAADQLSVGLHYEAPERLYTAACASCHYNSPIGPQPLRPDLGLNTAVHLADPVNLIRVMLYGVDASEGEPGIVMPAFAGFTDGDLARIAAYLRATRTTQAPWPDLERRIAAIRAEGPTND